MSSHPTIVLILGAFQLPFTMNLLSQHLQQAGYPTRIKGLATVNQPTLSIQDDVTALQNEILFPLIHEQGKDVVLYLQSYAGFPGSAAIKELSKAERLDARKQGGIVGLIYQSAFVPQEGQTLYGMIGGSPAPWQRPGQDKGLGYVEDPKQVLYGEPLATEVAKHVGGQSLKSLSTASGKVYYGDTAYDGRRAYIHTSKDQAMPPFAQDAFVAASGVASAVKRLQTSHSPFLSQPEDLAALVSRLAEDFCATYGMSNAESQYPSDPSSGTIEAIRGDDTSDARSREPAYHTTEAQYALPNDSVEHARLEDQALGFSELMHNEPLHVPLGSPQTILDIGCGTGIITRHLGQTYSAAQVYGIDLSPVPKTSGLNPTNVTYIQGDVRQLLHTDPRLALGTADFAFNRLLVLGMTDWPGYVRDVALLLKPGGWAEMQDYALEWYLHGQPCPQSSWLGALAKAAAVKGWDLHCGRNIGGYMQAAGLVDVQVRKYRVPFGTWAVKERPETRRIGEHIVKEVGTLYWHAIPKMLGGMGYQEGEIQGFREEAMIDFAAQEGKEAMFYVTIGRKP